MTKPTEIHSLTGLRGFAALMVVLFHANLAPIREIDQYQDLIIFYGSMFVDVFFVLSGFIMSHVYLGEKRRINWYDFYLARFARVYPLHIATAIAAAIGLLAIAKIGHKPWPPELNIYEALREITLTQALPYFGADQIWNSPSWSISVEFWTYFLLFPIAAWATGRLRWQTAILVATVFVLGGLVFNIMVDGEHARGWPALYRAMSGFGIGWAIWYFHDKNRSVTLPGWVTDASLIAIIIITQAFPRIYLNLQFISIIFIPILIIGLRTSDSYSRRVMESKPLLFLGDISYSIYLIHPLVLKLITVASARVDIIKDSISFHIFALLLLVIPISYASYMMFEQPSRKILRSLLSRRNKQVAQATS